MKEEAAARKAKKKMQIEDVDSSAVKEAAAPKAKTKSQIEVKTMHVHVCSYL